MNLLYYILILLAIYKFKGFNTDKDCYDYRINNDDKYQINDCDKELLDEQFVCKNESNINLKSLSLPWKYLNNENQTWMDVNTNITEWYKPIYCAPQNSKHICDNPMEYSSTISTITIFYNLINFKLNILMFLLVDNKCVIGRICSDCPLITKMIDFRFNNCKTIETLENSKMTIDNLKPNKSYDIYLIPVTNYSFIESLGKLSLRTKKEIPIPKNIRINNLTSNSMIINWKMENTENIMSYKICIKNYHDLLPESKDLYQIVYNLQPCKEYCFFIKSRSLDRQMSNMSETICKSTKACFLTPNILPIKSDLSLFTMVKWDYVQNIWETCNNCNGKVEYVIEYGINDFEYQVNSTNKFVNLTNLKKDRMYSVRVQPTVKNEKGPFSSIKWFLTMKIENLLVDYFQTHEFMKDSFKNSWVYSVGNPEINKIYRFLSFEEKSENMLIKQLENYFDENSKRINFHFTQNPNQINLQVEIDYNDNGKTIELILILMYQQQKCILISDCNTCSKLYKNIIDNVVKKTKSIGIKFCDNGNDPNLINRRTKYSLFVSTIKTKINGQIEIVTIHSLNLSDIWLFNIEWLLGFIIFLLLIILILIADKKGYISTNDIIKTISSRKKFVKFMRKCFVWNSIPQDNRVFSSSNNVVMNRLINNQSKSKSTEIKDTDHPQYQIIQEYNKICRESDDHQKLNFTFAIANLPENMKKNRFTNILPFDQTRVILQKRDLNSDYINASIIPSSNDVNVIEYIAAQGPMESTITDFWYMIWEQGVSVIVMLTQVYEGVNLKCEQYWPSSINTEYAFDRDLVLSVEMEQEIFNNSFIERKFKLINKNENQERKIRQIHMQKWNDFSKPKKHNFEEFITRFHEITSSCKSGPYLVHCSAGVGRTGTFIAIDRLIRNQLKENLNINTKDMVLELRKFRRHMVQQDSQYIFIHEFMDYFSQKYKRQSVHCQSDDIFDEVSLN